MSAKNRKLQVFVSSTYEDLKEERQAAVQAILNAGHIPAGMELFAAGDKSQLQVISEWIKDSDVYLLVLGGRYGSIEQESGKSYIHLEYEYAVELGMPLFSVVMGQDALEKKNKEVGSKVLELENPDKFQEFKKFVMSKMVRPWDDLKDIRLAVFESLAEFSKRERLVGWVKGDQVVDSGALTEGLVGLERENSFLKNKVMELERQSLVNQGFTVEELFSLFNKIRIDTRQISRFGIKNNEFEEIDANSLLLLLQYKINGVEAYDEYAISSMLSPYIIHGIITLKRQEHGGDPMDIFYIPKYSSEGIKYLFYLIKNHPKSPLNSISPSEF